ncbi:MAG: alpha/beta hydrolase [Clostridiales bacterium]|nr:alpha/beta hydrolase [Clostridiales bacterium]
MNRTNFDYRVIGTGKTTLIIETGIGNLYFDWLPVAKHLSKNHTVVLYHRLGYGESKITKQRRTTYNIATELYELVTALEIDKFILLAHSFGGLCAQHFALLYPKKLSGLILLDSASPRLSELEELDTPFLNEHSSIDAMISMSMEFSKKTSDERLKLLEDSLKNYKEKLSEGDYKAYSDCMSYSEFNITVANEFSEWIHDGEEIQKIRCSHDIPTIIICRDEQTSAANWHKNGVPKTEAEIHEKHWRALQEDLKSLSSQSELIIATGCDHMIHLEQPELVYKSVESLQNRLMD